MFCGVPACVIMFVEVCAYKSVHASLCVSRTATGMVFTAESPFCSLCILLLLLLLIYFIIIIFMPLAMSRKVVVLEFSC